MVHARAVSSHSPGYAAPVERSTWTDERLDEKMQGIDGTFELMRDELSGFRTEMREMRRELTEEMHEMRGDFTAFGPTSRLYNVS